MKRLAFLLSLLAVFAGTPALSAQDSEQYALYNYRNDGDFNAWLNIDVDSITYSCLDLNGVEHEDIVVQEVWTPDSVYRIPLDVIDSIGFQSPEIKFKDNVFHLTEAHVPYVRYVGDRVVSFVKNISPSMLPVVGQIVVSDVYDVPFDEGFAGRVLSITTAGDSVLVACEEVGLDDVFDQLVYVGRSICTAADEDGPSKAPRKLRINKDGTVELPLGKFKLDLISEKEIDGWTGETIDKTNYVMISGTPSLIIDYVIRYRAKGQENVFKVVVSKKAEYELDVQWPKSGKLIDKEAYLPTFIPIPTGIPGLYSKICFGGFVTVEGEVKVEAKIPFTEQVNIGYDSNKEEFGGLVFDAKGTGFDRPSLGLDVNGSVSAGVAFKFVTCIVDEKISSANIKVKAGPKLSGNINLSTNGFVDGGWSWYEGLKDTKVTFEPLVIKVSGGVELFNKTRDWTYTLPIGDYVDVLRKREFYIFPDFTAPAFTPFTDCLFSGLSATAMSTDITRDLLFPVTPGFVVYDKDEEPLDLLYSNSTYRFEDDWEKADLQLDMKGFEPGTELIVRPVFRYNYFDKLSVKARPAVKVTIPEKMSVGQTSVQLAKGETTRIKIDGGWGSYGLQVVGQENVATAWFDSNGEPTLNEPGFDPFNLAVFDDNGGSGWAKPMAPEAQGEPEPVYISIKAKELGKNQIRLTDLRRGESVIVDVEVVEEVIPDLALSATTLSMQPNQSATVQITAGSGQYDVANRNGDVAKGTLNGSTVTIEAFKAGTAIIEVADRKSGNTILVTVTVSKPMIPAEAVDLGLPSGTLWASYNVGASKMEEYGGYYAWGEIDEQPEEYFWTTYTHCDGVSNSNHDIGQDISGTEYDVAHMRWGDGWTMPTKADFLELTSFCERSMTTINGVKGFRFTAPNGKWVFLPAAGYRFRTSLSDEGTDGAYWSATQTTNVNYAHELSMDSEQTLWDCYINRFAGLTVRPVKHVVQPDGPQAIDLGLPSGTLWASCNVGATRREDFGGFYAWGETVEKTGYTLDDYTLHGKYNEDDGLTVLQPQDDVAHVLWGNGWHMPSLSQMTELSEKCTWTWTSIGDVNGFFISGPNGNSIFLPAAGTKSEGEHNVANERLTYWSNQLSDGWSSSAIAMWSWSSPPGKFSGVSRLFGYSVRAVKDK